MVTPRGYEQKGAGLMIFVMAGTQDGRELVKVLLENGYDVAASVVSRYGGELLAHACGQRMPSDK